MQLSLARSSSAEFRFWFPHSQCGLVRHLTFFLCLVFSNYSMHFIIPADTLSPKSCENDVDMFSFLTHLGSSTSLCQILVFHVIHSLSPLPPSPSPLIPPPLPLPIPLSPFPLSPHSSSSPPPSLLSPLSSYPPLPLSLLLSLSSLVLIPYTFPIIFWLKAQLSAMAYKVLLDVAVSLVLHPDFSGSLLLLFLCTCCSLCLKCLYTPPPQSTAHRAVSTHLSKVRAGFTPLLRVFPEWPSTSCQAGLYAPPLILISTYTELLVYLSGNPLVYELLKTGTSSLGLLRSP